MPLVGEMVLGSSVDITLVEAVMARVLCVLVVLLVTAVCDDGPAVVQEVVDSSDPWYPADNPNEVLKYETVRSQEYPVEDNSILEWLSGVTAKHGRRIIGVSKQCSQDLEKYWEALRRGELWASEIYDASGRYSSQLLFGNNFWLGSLSLCNEVSAPDFNVSFRVANVQVTLPTTFTPDVRIISLGLCQPASCSKNDTELILTSSTTISRKNYTITPLAVRLVPGVYSTLKDTLFHTLSGLFVVTTALVIIGTFYEVLQRPDTATSNPDLEKKGENNNAFEKDEGIEKKSEKSSNDQKDIVCGKREQKDKRRGTCATFFLAFSALSNGRRIMNSSSSSEDSLTFIHGLRFLSLTWVILVHTYLQLFSIGENKMIRAVTERSFMFQTIGNATFSVDTFFFISGLLLAYLYKRQLKKEGDSKDDSIITSTLTFLKLVVYRFIRLTPVYLVVLGIVRLVMTYVRNNSVFSPNIMDDENCQLFWWRNILYINNFFPRKEMCMIWSWYLAADTQFFTLGTMVLIMAGRKFKISAVILGVVLVASWCTTSFISYTKQYKAKIEAPFDLFDELYDKPWTRIGPYIMGMAAGWYLGRPDRTKTLPRLVTLTGWISSTVVLLSLVYGLGSGLSVPVSAVYVALGHTAWGLCLAWIAIACHMGHGGVINWLLSNSILHPVSRLTFCAYLIHPAIMFMTSFVMDGPFHIHNGIIVIIFMGNTAAAFLSAFLLSLLFESPVVRLLKMFLR